MIAFYKIIAYYPTLYNLLKNKLFAAAYNAIYCFSFCQIYFNKAYKYVSIYFNNFKKENGLIKDEVFSMDTNQIQEIDETEFGSLGELQNKILIKTNLISDISKKRIIYDLNEINLDDDFESSEIVFIALYLNYNDVRYNINLKTDDFNFYVVGNEINKNFIQYYINHILKVSFMYKEENMASYCLELMDQDVNMLNLNATQSIIIDKKGYHIKDVNESKQSKQ
jgi:hypothetical protein